MSFAMRYSNSSFAHWLSLHRERVRKALRATHVFGWALAAVQLAPPVKAAGSDMPWEVPLQAILDSVQGPVARIIAVIVIISTGLTLAFGDTSGGFRRLIQIVGEQGV